MVEDYDKDQERLSHPLGTLRGSSSTLEAYRQLLETEIKNLLARVGNLTNTQDELLVSVNDLTINLEEVVGAMERLETSRSYFREELQALQEATKKNEQYSRTLFKKLKSLQLRMEALERPRDP